MGQESGNFGMTDLVKRFGEVVIDYINVIISYGFIQFYIFVIVCDQTIADKQRRKIVSFNCLGKSKISSET